MRGPDQLPEEEPPDAAVLHLVDHGHRRFGRRRLVGQAHEAGDPDAVARIGVRRRQLGADGDVVPAIR